MSGYTFQEFQAEYPDDAACLLAIMKVQYGGTEIVCPACGVQTTFHAMTNRRAFACKDCGHHIYPCAGTIFHKSSTKLTHWFFAMYLMTSTRHGVAAKEIERQIGVTYKTAWRMCHELRKLMASADYQGPLSGHVEIDETRVGGHQSRRIRRAKGDNKTIVMGMIERDGRLRAGPIYDLSGENMERHVAHNVARGTTISTDEWLGYNRLGSLGYEHGTVQHNIQEYVRGIHHVNTLESHWGQLKRSIRGTHIHVSGKHLWKYVSEFSYRRNYRESHRGMFDHLIASISLPRLADA
jgi:transposase-like protein